MSASKKSTLTKFSQKRLLREYFLMLTDSERDAFVKRVGTTCAYIMQIYGGHSAGSPKIVRAIHDATNGCVPCWYLRPDVFDRRARTLA